MTYDCLELTLRTPGRFDTFAFTTAITKAVRERFGCDGSCGVTSYTLTPDGGISDGHPFAFQRVEIRIRSERGKVNVTELRGGLERYLAQTLKLDPTACYVADLRVSPDVLRSEFV